MIDFANLYNGKILLHADDVVVAASADVDYLADVIHREGGVDPNMILSSSFDFPEDYDFDGDAVALLNQAVARAETIKPSSDVITAYMIIDAKGFRWYYDTKAEMLESIRLGNVSSTKWYKLSSSLT